LVRYALQVSYRRTTIHFLPFLWYENRSRRPILSYGKLGFYIETSLEASFVQEYTHILFDSFMGEMHLLLRILGTFGTFNNNGSLVGIYLESKKLWEEIST